METKIILRFRDKLNLLLAILLVSLSLGSCSGRISISSSNAEDRKQYRQSMNRGYYGAQNTLSPFTEEHRAFLQKKYFGKSSGNKLRRIRSKNSPVTQN